MFSSMYNLVTLRFLFKKARRYDSSSACPVKYTEMRQQSPRSSRPDFVLPTNDLSQFNVITHHKQVQSGKHNTNRGGKEEKGAIQLIEKDGTP